MSAFTRCATSPKRATILNRFGNMRCIGLLSRGEISDGAGNLEHAVISARGPSEARPRFMQSRFARSIGLAQALYLSVGERAVGTVLALYLARISCPNPRGNHSAGFSSWAVHQLSGRKRWHFDLQIDPFQ